MAHSITRTLIAALSLTVLCQAFAGAQDHPATVAAPMAGLFHTWDAVSAHNPSAKKLILVTVDRPTHRQTCRIQSLDESQLVCKGPFGATRVYKPQQVAALITPGDTDVRLRLVLALNGVSAAAAWGTFVLAATCIPCAAATALVAAVVFFANGAVLMVDGQEEAVLYLAPAQTLQVKLH